MVPALAVTSKNIDVIFQNWLLRSINRHFPFLQHTIQCWNGERRIAAEELRNVQMPIPFDHRQQHLPPVFRAGLVATPQHRVLQITMLVEQKQRMVTEACKVAVVGRALLPAVGLTDRAVQIQDEFFERSPPVGDQPNQGEVEFYHLVHF